MGNGDDLATGRVGRRMPPSVSGLCPFVNPIPCQGVGLRTPYGSRMRASGRTYVRVD